MKIENDWEVSPRPWKKIKRTYSSRTLGQPSRELVDQDKDRTLKETRDTAIKLPFYFTAGPPAGHAKDLNVQDGQHNLSARSEPPGAARGIPTDVQVLHGPQGLNCAVSTRLSNRRLIEGIYKALEALLKATTCEKVNDLGGHRSLFSICLRQIPNYIAQEQHLTNEEDSENGIDVASEVYADLEAFSSAPDNGWEPLREVVKAHGISLVREAIQEGLIELSFSRHILSLCLGLAAYDEAESIIESMITYTKSQPLPPKVNTGCPVALAGSVKKWGTSYQLHAIVLTHKASRIADALRYFVSRTGRYGFMYRQMAVMLEDDVLPVDWLSSKSMIECWNGVIRSVAQQDDHAQSAALLLQIAISKSSRRKALNAKGSLHVHDVRLRACRPAVIRPMLRSSKSSQTVKAVVESQPVRPEEAGVEPDEKDNALQSTFSNILTVLSAINILRSPMSRLDINFLSVALLQDIALEIRQALELADINSHANDLWPVPPNQLYQPLLSAGLVSIASRKAGTEISQDGVIDLVTLANLPSSKNLAYDAGSFLCEVARCCDERQMGDGFGFVQATVQDLISIATSSTYDKPTRNFCSSIAHATAFAFSEDSGQPKHLDWALDVEGTITRMVDGSPNVVVDKTPARGIMRSESGYKWEEGICEWIAKTPASALQQPAVVEEDVDHESPYVEARKARKVTLAQALPLMHGFSPCAPRRPLRRSTRMSGGRGASCGGSETGKVKRSCGNPHSLEKLLLVRVSPRPLKVSCAQSFSKFDIANDLDELSTPKSSHEKQVALREITNPPSGVRGTSLGRKYNKEVVGKYNLDMLSTKRRRSDLETCFQDIEDELGLP